MPSYYLSNLTPTSVRVNVIADPAYSWYRVFVRNQPMTGVYYEQGTYNTTSSFYVDVYGLSPNTYYAVNVWYSTSHPDNNSGNTVGTQYFTTPKLPTGGSVCIGGVACTPYIYANGTWRKASPRVFSVDGWK